MDKHVSIDKYKGCFIGLATGDALGAPYEGGPIERLLWKLIGKTAEGKLKYTDDTQMSIDLAESFLANKSINQDHLALTFAKSYKWSRGYGSSAAKLLKLILKGKDWRDVNKAQFKMGSFGNGAAMRAPILALCYPNNLQQLSKNVMASSEITHAHPLSIEGATLIANVTYAAIQDWNNNKILDTLTQWCHSDAYRKKTIYCSNAVMATHDLTHQEIKLNLGNGIAAINSCMTAIYFCLRFRHRHYSDMHNSIFNLGGDTDTIAAMAGAIWGALHGVKYFSKETIQSIEGQDKILHIAERLHQQAINS